MKTELSGADRAAGDPKQINALCHEDNKKADEKPY
jgi:hypothetical protein